MTKTSRAEIISIARDLIRDKGYAGTSMKELANRVGLLKGSLYSHFTSKEKLVPEILALTYAQTFGTCTPSGDWRSDYATTLDRMVEMLTAHRRCVGLHLAYGMDGAAPEFAQAVRKFFNDICTLLETLLRQELDADIASSLALDTVTFVEGATLWLVIENNDAPMQSVKKNLLARIANYAQDSPDEHVRRILDQTVGNWRLASRAERELAERVSAAEDDALKVRAALEAASCSQ